MGIPMSRQHGEIFQRSSEKMNLRFKLQKEINEVVRCYCPFFLSEQKMGMQKSEENHQQTAQRVASWAVGLQLQYSAPQQRGALTNLGVWFYFLLRRAMSCVPQIWIFLWMWKTNQCFLNSALPFFLGNRSSLTQFFFAWADSSASSHQPIRV